MLHHEQQRAVGYPTFPGNIEALSLPAYSPERHTSLDSACSITTTTTTTVVSPPPPSSTSQTSTTNLSSQSSHSPKSKRRQTLAACRPCRKRKSKVRPCLTACDAAVPHLSRCQQRALSVTVRALGATLVSTKQPPAYFRSKKARRNNKLLVKNSRHIDPWCACCEEPHHQPQKPFSGTSDNTTM